jgi:hypothetical protein
MAKIWKFQRIKIEKKYKKYDKFYQNAKKIISFYKFGYILW